MRRKIGFLILAILAIGISAYGTSYFFLERSSGLLSTKTEELLEQSFWSLAFYTHIGFGIMALLTGWTQFNEQWRNRYLTRHKLIGRIYLVAVLLSGLSGLVIAQYATGGIISIIGFTLLAFLWLWTIFKAFSSIKAGNIDAHQRWMLRSYALTFSAVTLRIWLPLLILCFQDFFLAYQTVAWVSWIPNIIFVEWLIANLRRQKKSLSI